MHRGRRTAGHHRDQRNRDTENANQRTGQGGQGLQARTVGILAALAVVWNSRAWLITAVGPGIEGGRGDDLRWSVHRLGPASRKLESHLRSLVEGLNVEESSQGWGRQAGNPGVWMISSILPPMGRR